MSRKPAKPKKKADRVLRGGLANYLSDYQVKKLRKYQNVFDWRRAFGPPKASHRVP